VLIGVLVYGAALLYTPPTTSLLPTPAPQLAPESTAELTAEPGPETTAQPASLGQFPLVVAENLNGEALTLPTQFDGAYNLLVVPFDRAQQTDAIEWLATFQTLAASRPDLAYYSVAALTDLAPTVRLLVLGGLNLGVTDDTVRARTFVLFLEDQAAFVRALGAGDTASMRVLVVDGAGQVLHQQYGPYNPQAAAELSRVVAALPPVP
jgi:hypothetical protein